MGLSRATTHPQLGSFTSLALDPSVRFEHRQSASDTYARSCGNWSTMALLPIQALGIS